MMAPGVKAGQPIHYAQVPASGAQGVSTHVVHSDRDGSGLELSVLRFDDAGSSTSRQVADGHDEVLYVLSGAAELRRDGATHGLRADGAAHARAGTAYTVEAVGGPCEIAVVSGRSTGDSADPTAALDLADQSKHPAVSEREFQLLFGPEHGCGGMTQFVGFVPKVRTPRHIHPYSEMLCIVRGHGLVEIDGQETRVGPGSCYYLPAGTPHLVQNQGDEFLVELGVFTPAGSPAQNSPVE